MIVQLIGALLLFFPFSNNLGFFDSIFYVVFHSISAFTNAGLDLFETSLIQFQDNHYVLLVMTLLIMTGGIGFLVWDDLLNYRINRKLHIYTKIVLITTTILWVAGIVLYWFGERNNGIFSHLSPGKKS